MKRASHGTGGFTLTENLLAMTLVVTVAVPLTGMLGMASSSRSLADHRREAAHIARQIAAELSHSTAELGAPPTEWRPLIAIRPVTGEPDQWPYLMGLPSNLSGHSVFLGYDAEFQPSGLITPAEYESGVDEPATGDEVAPPFFAIQIHFESVPGGSGPASTVRAVVTVGSPAQAPAKARREETFTTLIHVPEPATGT